jgi:flagellar hook protein FlgE
MISNNISSINAHNTWMNVNSNNVANVNTDGFVPSGTVLSETGNSAVNANVSGATDTGSPKSQTSVSKELTDQVVVEKSVGLNAEAIKTQDEMLGTLLDMKA